MSNTFAHLKSFVQRVERIQEEIDALNADKKEIYAEAKGTGFDTKVMKLLIAERRKDQTDLAETNEILDLYRAAMNGTDVAFTHTRAGARNDFDQDTGEIIAVTEPLAREEKSDRGVALAVGPAQANRTPEALTAVDAAAEETPAESVRPYGEPGSADVGTTATAVGGSPAPIPRAIVPEMPPIPDFLRRANTSQTVRA